MSALASLMDNGPSDQDSEDTQSAPGNNVMQRAFSQRMNSPASLVQQGINHLNDSNNGLSFEQKMSAIVPLLQAKHFGVQGPAAGGNIQTPQVQENQGAMGFANKIMGGAKLYGALA